MAVTDFSTKAAVVVRDDLAAVATAERHRRSSSAGSSAPRSPKWSVTPTRTPTAWRTCPLLVQPLLVFEASADQLRKARAESRRAAAWRSRSTPRRCSRPGTTTENRAAVRAVATEDLDLVGIALRAGHRDADAVLRGLGAASHDAPAAHELS